MRHLRIPLRIVLYKEDTMWVAHCLEFGLVGHGETKEQAAEMLRDAICVQFDSFRNHQNLADLFFSAPSDIQARFAAGKDATFGVLQFEGMDDVTISGIEAREFDETDAVLV